MKTFLRNVIVLALIWIVFPNTVRFNNIIALLVTSAILMLVSKVVYIINTAIAATTAMTGIIVITWPITILAYIFLDSISLYIISNIYSGVTVNAGFFGYMLIGAALGLTFGGNSKGN